MDCLPFLLAPVTVTRVGLCFAPILLRRSGIRAAQFEPRPKPF